MSQVTKRALEASLKKLLLEKPLHKITVSDITDDCGINRIAALGDLRGEMPELRKRYPRLDMTTWTRENRVQA